MKLRIPDFRRKQFEERAKAIENLSNKTALTRMFFLILDGSQSKQAYNKALAEKYYAPNSPNSRMGSVSNPKVTSIYLKELVDAGVVKKGEKDGKFQHYEIDWFGVFDIIVYSESSNFTSSWIDVNIFYLKYMKISEKDENDFFQNNIYPYYIENFVKPYFYERMNDLQKPKKTLNYRGVCTIFDNGEIIHSTNSKNYERPKDFDTVETYLLDEFMAIGIAMQFVYNNYRDDVNEYVKKKENQNCPLYWLFSFELFYRDPEYRYSIYDKTPIGGAIDNLVTTLKGGKKNGFRNRKN